MKFKEIPINKIKILDNIRQRPIAADLSFLMRDIKENGLMQPIGVKEEKNNFILIHGFRRLTACKKLGWKKITARIMFNANVEMTDKDFFILNTVENIQREDINAFELGRIVDFFKTSYEMSNSEVAARLSLPKTRVKNAFECYSKVPKIYRGKIAINNKGAERKGTIPFSVASQVLRMNSLTNLVMREKVLDWVNANDDVTNLKLTRLNALITAGVPIPKAIKKLDKLKVINTQMIVDKKLLKRIEEGGIVIQKIIKGLVRKKYGDEFIY